jgi:IS4 transposase
MYKIHKAGAYFVVRIKRNMVYEIVDSSDETDNIVLADQIIKFTSRWAHNGYPDNLRLITYYSTEKNITLKFLTNNTELPAVSIALAYKYRWDIELFFRWIKQHLRITSFYGTSHNAVAIQIYTAFIAYCLIAIVADEIKFEGSLYELANILSVSSMEKILIQDLIKRLDNAEVEPFDYGFPSLFDE